MFRRRRTSFLTVLPLLLTVAAVLGPARQADAGPLGGELAKVAWRWLAAALSLESLDCDHGLMIDPNGRCLPAHAQETLTCDAGLMVDPNGVCGPAHAQEALTCDHGSMIDPDGRCLQSPAGPLG